jgi:hypothetical protein
LRDGDRLPSTRCFTDNLDVRRGPQQGSEPVAQDRVVVDEHDANGAVGNGHAAPRITALIRERSGVLKWRKRCNAVTRPPWVRGPARSVS